MGTVKALCISENTGEQKTPVESAVFLADCGIEGDAHAGDWHRQVSLLLDTDIESIRQKGLDDLSDGDFAENVILSGVDLNSFGLGTRLRLGDDVVLSISQIGKVCHTRCRIFYLAGDCIMPRLGIFARVESGGTVRPGDRAEAFDVIDRDTLQAVVLTISDRCSRGEAEDTAGPATASILTESLGANIYRTEILPDDKETIAARLKHYSDGHSIDLMLAVGGTGFSPRDVTPEAAREVIDRLTPGLDEAMRTSSAAKTPHAMLSRAVSGIAGSTLIITLPGSQRAATENLQAVLPALGHGLAKLRGDKSDCGRPQNEEQADG
ncbi:MAG: molybdopterin-binding protein [Phycisphaerae bacterium]|jgi:molybdenum cofactor synthesis domain-containing protein|nr:molybdopterin-binding protein [Phycisphaerae bacterium]